MFDSRCQPAPDGHIPGALYPGGLGTELYQEGHRSIPPDLRKGRRPGTGREKRRQPTQLDVDDSASRMAPTAATGKHATDTTVKDIDIRSLGYIIPFVSREKWTAQRRKCDDHDAALTSFREISI